MNVKHKVDYLEQSSAKVTITINQSEAQQSYTMLVDKYTKEASLPGFRKGKVPKSMLEGKYGEAFKAEALNSLIDDSMREVFPLLERKPLGYASPKLDEEPVLDFTKDISFTLTIDVEPNFETPNYKSIVSDSYMITITDDDIMGELKKLQEQNSVVVDKLGKSQKGDLLTVSYHEVDTKGNEVAGTRREDFVFTIGEGNTLYEFDDDTVVGLVKGDTKVVEKSFSSEHHNKDLAGKSIIISTTVLAVKEKKIPALDDELAQDINEKFKTLAELKTDIKEKLQLNANTSAKNKQLNDLIKQLASSCIIDLPESMIKAESDTRFSNFARQSGFGEESLLKMLGGDKESLSERWREESIESVKSRLILDRILKSEKIEASDAEINDKSIQLSTEYGMSIEQIKQQFGGNFLNFIKNEVEDTKLHDYLLSSAQAGVVKEMSLSQFVELGNSEEKK